MTKKPRLVALRVERWPHTTQDETAEALERPEGALYQEQKPWNCRNPGLSERLPAATSVPAAAPGPAQAGSSWASGRPLVDVAL